MENNIFDENEISTIKERIVKHANSMEFNDLDTDRAYSRFEFVLSKMSNNLRVRFLNNVDYFIAQKSLKNDKYDLYGYYAVKMDRWLAVNFIVDITKNGNIMFLPMFPDKENKYPFKAASDKIWTREELESELDKYLAGNNYESDDEIEQNL